MPTRRSLHDSDFYAWSLEQAALLRAGGVGDVDLAAIAEEIESMGKTEKRELISRLTVLLLPLLKWQRQPGGRGNSWRLSIADARDEIADSSPTIQAERPSSTRRRPHLIATRAARRQSRRIWRRRLFRRNARGVLRKRWMRGSGRSRGGIVMVRRGSRPSAIRTKGSTANCSGLRPAMAFDAISF